MTLEVTVRSISLADLGDVVEIENQSFSFPFTRDMFENMLGQEPFSGHVVLKDGHVAGYSLYSRVIDEMQLITIAVRQDARRQGLGKALMDAMLKDARDHDAVIIYLDVRESNVAAQCLYKAYGFTPIGVRKKYYQDNNEDAIVMTLSLKTGAS